MSNLQGNKPAKLVSKTWPIDKTCLDFSVTDHVKCPTNILTSKVRVWKGREGRKDGKRKRGKEV